MQPLSRLNAIRLRKELLGNGAFDSSAAWTLGADLSIGSGVVTAVASGAARNASQTPVMVAGGLYHVAFTITARTAGTVNPRILGATNSIGASVSTAQKYTDKLVAPRSPATFAFNFNAAAAMSADNASMMRIA